MLSATNRGMQRLCLVKRQMIIQETNRTIAILRVRRHRDNRDADFQPDSTPCFSIEQTHGIART